MRFGVLGPLTVLDGNDDRTPTAPKQRQLLALLLRNANSAVPVNQIIEELWDFDPPPTALAAVQTYVKQLRRSLPGRRASRLVTHAQGYSLEVHPDDLDVTQFHRRLEPLRRNTARIGPAAVARACSSALDLWRGPALVDVTQGPLLKAVAMTLEEERLDTLVRLIGAQLELGLHRALVADISSLVCRHPTSEALSAQLMLALYRSDRRADALAEYHRLRLTLRADVASTPSPALQKLNTDIILGRVRLQSSRHAASPDYVGALGARQARWNSTPAASAGSGVFAGSGLFWRGIGGDAAIVTIDASGRRTESGG